MAFLQESLDVGIPGFPQNINRSAFSEALAISVVNAWCGCPMPTARHVSLCGCHDNGAWPVIFGSNPIPLALRQCWDFFLFTEYSKHETNNTCSILGKETQENILSKQGKICYIHLHSHSRVIIVGILTYVLPDLFSCKIYFLKCDYTVLYAALFQ